MRIFSPTWRIATSPNMQSKCQFFPLSTLKRKVKDESLFVDESGVMRKDYRPRLNSPCGSIEVRKPALTREATREICDGEGLT